MVPKGSHADKMQTNMRIFLLNILFPEWMPSKIYKGGGMFFPRVRGIQSPKVKVKVKVMKCLYLVQS